jgi:hypothetical protein
VVVETTGFVDFCQKYTNQANFYRCELMTQAHVAFG